LGLHRKQSNKVEKQFPNLKDLHSRLEPKTLKLLKTSKSYAQKGVLHVFCIGFNY